MARRPAADGSSLPARVRPVKVEGDRAFITLTKGHEAVIDRADVWMVERYNWFAMTTESGKVYAGRGCGLDGRKYTIMLHRFLTGAPTNLEVDHKDGDGLNCRRSNLRLAERADNARNVKTNRRNKLGVKGVFHNGSSFVAYIGVAGKRRYLGSYSTVEEAKAAYDAAAAEAFGKFVREGA